MQLELRHIEKYLKANPNEKLMVDYNGLDIPLELTEDGIIITTEDLPRHVQYLDYKPGKTTEYSIQIQMDNRSYKLTYPAKDFDVIKEFALNDYMVTELYKLRLAGKELFKHYSGKYLGTGKLPPLKIYVLKDLEFSDQNNPTVIITSREISMEDELHQIKGYSHIYHSNNIKFVTVQAWRYVELGNHTCSPKIKSVLKELGWDELVNFKV